MQGLILQVASFARTVGPIIVTHIFTSFGPRGTWLMEIALILLALACVCGGYTHLKPLRHLSEMRSGEKCRYKLGVVYKF
jgi:uncharacterized iron-regulated membrane protein